jgi:hypothetical protein
MSTAVSVILLVLFILILVGAVLGVVGIALRRQVRRTGEQWASQGIILRKGPEHASYRGHASVSVPMRGGALALTDRDLRFIRLLPRREFIIPLGQITRVEQHRSWKGNYSAGSPVIVVHYRDGDREDAIGLSVRRTPDWLDAIDAAKGANT